MTDLKKLRIGYVPYSPALNLPGDRRRFAGYARARGIDFEIADPRKSYDLVVLSERADITVWSGYRKGRIVFDLIDSYLAIPRTDLKGRLRGLAKFVSRQHRYLRLDHWRALEDMCRRSDAVICTTAEQKRDIEILCRNVHIILDIHSSVIQQIKTDYDTGREFKLVWEGLPATVEGLFLIKDALHAVRRKHPISLHIVTDPIHYRFLAQYGGRDVLDMVRKLELPVTLHPWDEKTCAAILCGCDAALIPLDLNDPFAAGKPENKLLLLWRMGIPTVVSASPAYQRAMASAGLDYACHNADDWQRKIEHLIENQAARIEAGTRGREYAETHFGETQLLAQWDAMFASLF